jgi:hypothetical protein
VLSCVFDWQVFPRTNDFGVDFDKLREMIGADTTEELFQLAVDCCGYAVLAGDLSRLFIFCWLSGKACHTCRMRYLV